MARKQENNQWCEVLAFDPGGTTGWAVMCIKPKDLLNTSKPLNRKLLAHFAHGQILGSELAQVDQSIELVDIWPKAAVVAESFVQRIRNTGLETDVAYSPVRINAIMKWWLATEDRYLFKQSPAMAKDSWTDERLEAGKLSPEGGRETRHARDGVRHAALFLSRARDGKGLRHTAWPQFFNKDGSLV
jgi:hypothetical protein